MDAFDFVFSDGLSSENNFLLLIKVCTHLLIAAGPKLSFPLGGHVVSMREA